MLPVCVCVCVSLISRLTNDTICQQAAKTFLIYFHKNLKGNPQSTISSIYQFVYVYLYRKLVYIMHFHTRQYLHRLLFLVYVCVCVCLANNYVNEAHTTPNYRYTYLAAYRHHISSACLASHANHLSAQLSRSRFPSLFLSLSGIANIELGADKDVQQLMVNMPRPLRPHLVAASALQK